MDNKLIGLIVNFEICILQEQKLEIKEKGIENKVKEKEITRNKSDKMLTLDQRKENKEIKKGQDLYEVPYILFNQFSNQIITYGFFLGMSNFKLKIIHFS